jgi:cysteine dioxygenase
MNLTKLIESLNFEFEVNKTSFKDEKIKNILETYLELDWIKFIKLNENDYNRNLVYQNNFFEIFIITWNINQKAKIHNHAENGCWLKLLQGQIKEDIYDDKINIITSNILSQNCISFMKDDIGLHSIQNIGDIAVSLHIYSPINHRTHYF